MSEERTMSEWRAFMLVFCAGTLTGILLTLAALQNPC